MKTFYAAASYLDECCCRPHCFLIRVRATDVADAEDKLEEAMREADISEDAINDCEVHVLRHRDVPILKGQHHVHH
jgi:hypothetical protein